ncbi:AAA family ATPase [Candidatus Poribacteria bacterium]
MKCSKCEHENPGGAKFCMACGTKLEPVCSECGAKLPSEAKFCMKCGTKIAETDPATTEVVLPKLEDVHTELQRDIPESLARRIQTDTSDIEGENRILSILFADVSGSVATTEDMSPEAAAELISKCLRSMVDSILKYEGAINRFLGDSVLAFFGTPETHENDPERSILAALEMREAVTKLNLNISIGINTGMVYVGAIGPDSHREFTAMGTAVNLAARLEDIAEPGQILVGEATYRPARRAFEFDPLLPLEIRGISEPVHAYEVLKALPRPDKIRGIEGLRVEMIGREREFAALKESVDGLLSGRGQIVSIIGEAGVGKSRLVSELKEYLAPKWDRETRGKGDKESIPLSPPLHVSLSLLEGRYVSIGESIGYWVFLDILRDYLAFSEDDRPEDRGEKIVSKMQFLFPQRWEEMAPYMGNLLSVKFGNEWDDKIRNLPPEQVKQQTFFMLRDVLFALAQRRPLLVILEDLHWADNLSLDIVNMLMDDIIRVPIMLLCVYRPEREHRSWHIGTWASAKCPGGYTEITLRGLNDQESRRLVESLLSIENLPESVRESILEKAEGNPFFVEEVIRSLIESDIIYQDGVRWMARKEIEDIAVPDTIQSVVMARIDRLEDEVKYILQSAAVIGKLFRHKLLQYTTQQEQNLDRYLWQLGERDLIYEERAIPELEYSFKHVLAQETAYNTILSRRRRESHQKVAQGYEALYASRLEEYYEELAYHYSRSEDDEKAVEYLLKAGKRAKDIYANQEAISYFKEALRFIQAQSVDKKQVVLEVTAREELGDVLFTTGDHQSAEVQFKQSLSLASGQEDAGHIARLTCKLADVIHWQMEYDRAIEMAESGLAKLEEQTCSPEAADLLELITRSYWAMNDWESAGLYADRNAQIIHQIPYYPSIYKIYYSLAWVEIVGRKNLEAAIHWLEEMEQVCLENDNKVGLARCYHGRGDLYRQKNEFDQAVRWFEESLIYCEQTGESHLLMEGHLELAHLLILLDGAPEQIDDHIQQGIRLAEYMSGESELSSASGLFGALASAYLTKSDIQQTLLYFRLAIEFGLSGVFLYYRLCEFERLCVEQEQHEVFFDFCRQMQPKSQQSQVALSQWYLEPSELSGQFEQPIFIDEFDASALNPEWQWISPGDDCRYDLTSAAGWVEIRATSGCNLFPGDCNAPRLLQDISGEFAVEVRMKAASSDVPSAGGILVWKDEENFIRFERGVYGEDEIGLADVIQGEYKRFGRGMLDSDMLYLRLERTGDRFSAYCSSDGENWMTCGAVDFPVEDPIQVGIHAITNAGIGVVAADTATRFDYFQVLRRA